LNQGLKTDFASVFQTAMSAQFMTIPSPEQIGVAVLTDPSPAQRGDASQ